MISTDKVCLVGLGVLASCLAACAVTPDIKVAEYSIIADRNPFGLVDPPPKPAPAPPDPNKDQEKETPPPGVELTGFFRNGRNGKTVALFLVDDKEGTKTTKESFMWAVGEGDKGVKVIAINQAEETVKLEIRGKESTVTFTKPKAAAAAAPALAIPGRPNMRVPTIPAVRNPREREAERGPHRFDNSRTGHFGRSSTTSSAVGGAYQPQPVGTPGNMLQSIPARDIRVGGSASAEPAQPQVSNLTPDQQAILIEVNRAVSQQNQQNGQGGAIMPPLPPTKYTPPEDLSRILVPPTQQGPPARGQQ